MDFQTNKTLGGIGALLLFIGCLTFISPAVGILGLIGFILVLIAINLPFVGMLIWGARSVTFSLLAQVFGVGL